MLVASTIGALGAAAFVYEKQLGTQKKKQKKRPLPLNPEQRECMHSGFLRSANRGSNVIDSEETRAVRPVDGHVDPRFNAAEWQRFFYEKNNTLAKLYSGANGALDNLGILRYSYSKKPGLLMLPNYEGFSEFDLVPNAKFDRISADAPLDERVDLFRDPFGNAGGAPIQGRSNVVLNRLYVGNPWGPGGQQFRAVGNEHRDPGYADNRPTGILKKDDVPSIQKLEQRVTFAQQ